MTQSGEAGGGPARLSMSTAVAWLAAIAAALLYAWSFTAAADPAPVRALALLVLAIGLFASHALPGYLTALIAFFLAILTGVGPPEVVFAGFQSGGTWLLFSGIVIGLAVGELGLGAHVARMVLSRIELTYFRAVALLVAVSVLLSFFMPATIPRIIVLLPIALALAEAMGFRPGSRGHAGLASAVAVGTMLPAFSIMTATLPGVVMVGAIETVYGVTPTYAEYLLYLFPIGVVRALAVIAIVVLLFRQPPQEARLTEAPGQLNRAQWRLLAILCGALLFWLTDLLHGVAPAWISMGAAIVILLPRIGVLDPMTVRDRANLAPVIYIAGILSIGAIVGHSGLDEAIGTALLRTLHLEPGNSVVNFYAVIGISMAVSLMVTQPASPVLLVPLAAQVSEATGLNLTAVLMTQLLGLSTMFLPYQGPPLIVALGMARLRMADLARLCTLVAIVSLVLGAPLTYVWWRAIGLLP